MEKPEDGVEVVGGEGGAVGPSDPAAAEEVVPDVVAVPSSYTAQAVNDSTPDQAHAAVARGPLAVPQMKRLLGGFSVDC